MSMTRWMAIDLGASGGKCFVGALDGGSFAMQEIHRFAHEGVSFYIPGQDGAITERTYWNDTLLYQNMVIGLQNYRREISGTLDSIGIDTWGADGHLMSADGEMLGKVYCYRDHRLDPMVEIVKSRVEPRRIYEITGIHFQPFNLSNQLYWFVKNRKDLLRPGSFYLPIPSLFYYYLGGVRVVDSSWASVTQLMDAKSRKWSAELLEKLEIPAGILPEIVNPGAVVGELSEPLARSLDLNRAKLIAAASHDTASAFAAAPVDNPDEALIISSGTWSLVGRLIPEPITTTEAMAANLSNEGGIGNIRLLKNVMGTWLVQELRRVWKKADGKDTDWKVLDRLTREAPAFFAMLDPDDPGFYNPANMEKAIVDYCVRTGQPPPPDRGTFLRVVYESLALKYRMVNEQICRVCGGKSRVVHIVGGGSKNVMLNQYTADSLGVPVLAGPEEGTAVGNLMVQAMGLGLIQNMREAIPLIKQAFPICEYKPQDVDTWNRAYERFSELCRRTS